jgi:hypothetical protein
MIILYNLKKVALISASANRDKTVTAACLAAAIKFMDWQLRLREVFRPSEAIGTPGSTLADAQVSDHAGMHRGQDANPVAQGSP